MVLDSKEHKFRGKTENGSWAYGAYLKHQKVLRCIASERMPDETEHLILHDGPADWNMPMPVVAVAVREDSIGEYIGIKDVNHKEIYTGDIVRFNDTKCKVAYIDGCFAIVANDYIERYDVDTQWSDRWIGFDVDGVIPFNELMWNLNEEGKQDWLDEVEIIGNRIDNPDEWNDL